MKTILVPTDFSENATQALNYAAALATHFGGKLIIAHIINLPVTSGNSGLVLPPDPQLEGDYEKELNNLALKLRLQNNAAFEIEVICQYGFFLASLNDLVKSCGVDLVVMGTQGATNFLDKLIGTNTASFIKMAACPVLAIPAGAKFNGIKNIAYASDFESEEQVFLEQLFSLADPLNAEVSIINILTERHLNIFSDNQVVRDIMHRFTDKHYSIAQIQEDDVVEGIQKFVEDVEADVLAVSIHARGVLEDLFHSSISKKLLYHSTLPLLSLPEKPIRKSGFKTQKQNSKRVA
jgi:nucleotide-binding universal stress UspA family protein